MTQHGMHKPWEQWLDGEVAGDGGRVAVRVGTLGIGEDDSFALPTEGVTVIVGANNSGKSTLLRQVQQSLISGNQTLPAQSPLIAREIELHITFTVHDFLDWLAKNYRFHYDSTLLGGGSFATPASSFSRASIASGPYGEPDWLGQVRPLLSSLADARTRLMFQMSHPARHETSATPSHPLHQMQDDRSLFENLRRMAKDVFGVNLIFDDYSGSNICIRVGEVDLPIPRRDEPLGAFGEEVARLPRLEEQGDGMISFFALMIPLLAGKTPTVLIDEPEAFLHPPQARALGRELSLIAEERSLQIITATHDKDLIAGLLTAGTPVNVIRIVRSATRTSAVQLSASRLRETWDDRVLRYSNVLDGLFSKMVVLAEGAQDCRFYEAAFDYYLEHHGANERHQVVSVDEILFVPTYGAKGAPALLKILRELRVPTATIVDIDVLLEGNLVERIIEASGSAWDGLNRSLKVVNSSAPESSRSSLKRAGAAHFRGEARREFDILSQGLDAAGTFLVHVGELEGFAPKFTKGHDWLPQALKSRSFESNEAQELVRRVLGADSQPAS